MAETDPVTPKKISPNIYIDALAALIAKFGPEKTANFTGMQILEELAAVGVQLDQSTQRRIRYGAPGQVLETLKTKALEEIVKDMQLSAKNIPNEDLSRANDFINAVFEMALEQKTKELGKQYNTNYDLPSQLRSDVQVSTPAGDLKTQTNQTFLEIASAKAMAAGFWENAKIEEEFKKNAASITQDNEKTIEAKLNRNAQFNKATISKEEGEEKYTLKTEQPFGSFNVNTATFAQWRQVTAPVLNSWLEGDFRKVGRVTTIQENGYAGEIDTSVRRTQDGISTNVNFKPKDEKEFDTRVLTSGGFDTIHIGNRGTHRIEASQDVGNNNLIEGFHKDGKNHLLVPPGSSVHITPQLFIDESGREHPSYQVSIEIPGGESTVTYTIKDGQKHFNLEDVGQHIIGAEHISYSFQPAKPLEESVLKDFKAVEKKEQEAAHVANKAELSKKMDLILKDYGININEFGANISGGTHHSNGDLGKQSPGVNTGQKTLEVAGGKGH